MTVSTQCGQKKEKTKKKNRKKKKGNEILPFARIWMDVEGFMLNEASQTEKHMLYNTTYM